jgi:pantetheine-phosphate adenylyltransferase
VSIEPISDIFGPTLEEPFDVIVVSAETRKTAEIINEKRWEKGWKPLTIVEIPFVLAEDGKPIQSSRIINGEIDVQGKTASKKDSLN